MATSNEGTIFVNITDKDGYTIKKPYKEGEVITVDFESNQGVHIGFDPAYKGDDWHNVVVVKHQEETFEYGIYHKGLGEFLQCGYAADSEEDYEWTYFFPSKSFHVKRDASGVDDHYQICVTEDTIGEFIEEHDFREAMRVMGIQNFDNLRIVRVHSSLFHAEVPDFTEVETIEDFIK